MELSSKGTLIKRKWNPHKKMEHSSKGHGTLIQWNTHQKEMEPSYNVTLIQRKWNTHQKEIEPHKNEMEHS